MPGNVSAIGAVRDALGGSIGPAETALTALSGVRVDRWSGQAADRFAHIPSAEALRVAALSDACRRAASAIDRWEAAVRAAQAAAQHAIHETARADALSPANGDRPASEGGTAGSAASVLSFVSPALIDPGRSVRAEARAALDAAVATLGQIGEEVAAAIRPPSTWSPSDPDDRTLLDQVLFFPSDMFLQGILGGLAETLVGVAESAWWTFETFDAVRFMVDDFNLGDPWQQAWADNFLRRMGEVGDGVAYVSGHWQEVSSELVAEFFAAEHWATQPGAAFGRVVYNTAALATVAGEAVRTASVASRVARLARLGEVEARAVRLFTGNRTVTVKNETVFVNGAPKMSVTDWLSTYEASVHNMDAVRATLGKYYPGEARSYENVAEASGDAYFNMPSKPRDLWKETQEKHGLTNDEMFELFNKPFLQEIVEKRMPVRFTVDPENDTGYLRDEFDFLGDSGYEFNVDTMMMVPGKGL